MLVRIHPGVAVVQPHFKIPILTPGRCSRLLDLDRNSEIEKVTGRYRRDLGLVEMKLANEIIQELRPFVPPVPEKLCIVRRDDKRRMPFECFAKLISLLNALPDEMPGVFGRFLPC